KKEGLTFSSQLAVLFVERVFDIGCFALLLIFDVLFADSLKDLPHFEVFQKAGFALILVVAFVCLVLFLIWRNPVAVSNWVEKRLARFPAAARVACERIRTFSAGLRTIHDWKSFLQLLSLSIG